MTCPRIPRDPWEHRSDAELHAAFERERAWADRLRAADRDARAQLFAEAYADLDTAGVDDEAGARQQFTFLSSFLQPGCRVLELGAGPARLARLGAETAGCWYAADLVPAAAGPEDPERLVRVRHAGTGLPPHIEGVDLVYCHHVVEHWHPDDAALLLRGIATGLVPGGCFICITPNRINGPHDISKYYRSEPAGLHLMERTWREWTRLLREAGFCRLEAWTGFRGRYLRLPLKLFHSGEFLVSLLPHRARQILGRRQPFRSLLEIRLVARTPATAPGSH